MTVNEGPLYLIFGQDVRFSSDEDEVALRRIDRLFADIEKMQLIEGSVKKYCEEELNEFLKKQEINSIETDLGDYIQQLAHEPSYHMVTPAVHKSKEDIARLFQEQPGTPPHLSPAEAALLARKTLRPKYTEAEIGITGGNFLIAKEGAVCITENEGNARLVTTFPKTHIVLIGIEKILPSLKDLELFWPLLAGFGTGQKVTAYNSIFFGPRQAGETDGPRDMYVILLDNGRTALLDKAIRESLYCIRCGACLNACPVYKNIGGHTYDTTYTGPIGSVITPHLKDMHTYGHLSYASTLCGSCTQACPVNINIHGLLLKNRHIYVANGYGSLKEKLAWRLFKRGMLHRNLMNSASGKMKNLIFQKVFQKAWGARRTPLTFPDKSFNQRWKKEKRNRLR